MAHLNHVSIVIPTYNRLAYIQAAVDACLNLKIPSQWTYSIVVVDDGSTDGTADFLIKQYALIKSAQLNAWSANNLQLLVQDNRERGAARNSGAFLAIKHAQAKWLLFTDADDVLTPETLLHFAERLARLPQGVACAALYANLQYWKNGHVLGGKRFKNTPPEGKLTAAILQKPTLSIGTTLISAALFQKLQGFSEDRAMSGSEDWEFWLRLSLQGPIFYSDHVSMWYRQHEGNTSAERFEKSIAIAIAKMQETLRAHDSAAAPQLIQQLLVTASLWVSGSFNAEGNHQKAWRYFWRAAKWSPSLLFSPKGLRLCLSLIWGMRR